MSTPSNQPPFVVPIIEYVIKTRGFELICHAGITSFIRTPPAGIRLVDAIITIGLPIFILCIYLAIISKIVFMKNPNLKKRERTILIQAVIIFVLFQIPSSVFFITPFFSFGEVAAFLIKRFVNTMEIFAGAVTPTLFFFTSQDIRKMLSSRVYASSSTSGENPEGRRRVVT